MPRAHQGVALAIWRHGRALSQVAAAEALGVAQAAWAAWETGRKTPDLSNALELERLTGGVISAAKWGRKRRVRKKKAA